MRTALIKSNNPHLAGGEKTHTNNRLKETSSMNMWRQQTTPSRREGVEKA